MEIYRHTAPSPKGEIELFTITNDCGASVELSSLGAGIVAVVVPDRDGNMADVALGYANPADYIYDGPCAGKIPGRYANRIAKGHFSIDGQDYSLAINNGPNALHGGPEGFQNQIWKAEPTLSGVRFTYEAKDGEEGYPGNLKVTAEYSFDNSNRLTLKIQAQTDKATVVNLTNHTYWNLKGENAGSVLSHLMSMRCSKFLPGDDTLIPSGEFAPVAGTPMDFTTAKELGKDIKADFPAINFAKGYDSSWVIDDYAPGKLVEDVVRISEPETGRILSISTTQPAAHVYTGNWLDGSPVSKSGRPYRDYDGVAVEMQGMPDAPNKPQFPSQLLRPGQTYHHTIRFAFSTDK
jgi:aldose 1-epimerase